MKKNIKVSVIIPVLSINDFLIKENFPALDRQQYRNFEVIVLPNATRQKDKALLSEYHWLRIIPTGRVTRPAEKRDVGVKNAKGDIIAFIDDDAFPDRDWLENAVRIFARENVAAVCGPGLIPARAGFWEKAFDLILQSPFGSGGYRYRFAKGKRRLVDDYPSMNFLIKKGVFEALGGFNNQYWPGEDSKLCEDLVYKKGGEILYHPDVVVYHHRRDNLGDYLKQHGGYGFHRGAFFAHGDKNSRRLTYWLPTFFVLYLMLVFLSFLSLTLHWSPVLVKKSVMVYVLFLPIGLYGLTGLALTIRSMMQTKTIDAPLLFLPIALLTHLTYGALFIKGVFFGLTKKKNIYNLV
ncbi:glycosyltransferase [Patescibacteria group bacterium]|nr:glycosyltransferase [Patescibacteria group bacterium]